MNTQTKMFVQFDPATGRCLGCSTTQMPNSMEIELNLGEKFIMGMENMSNYEVHYDNSSYSLRKKGVLQHIDSNNTVSTTEIINPNVYKIPDTHKNDSAICITVNKTLNRIEFSASNRFKKTLQAFNPDDQNRSHMFYCCKRNDATQILNIFEVDLKMLCDQDSVNYDWQQDYNIDFYCKKIFDYGVARTHG